MPAKRKRLAERQPALASKSVLDHRAPENEDVGATILPGRRSVLGHGEGLPSPTTFKAGPRARGPPQLSDDLVGDFVIEIRPALAGARPNNMSRHRGSPRGAPRAFLATSNPSRSTRPALSLLDALTALKRSNFGERFREGRVRDGSPKGEDSKPTARPRRETPKDYWISKPDLRLLGALPRGSLQVQLVCEGSD